MFSLLRKGSLSPHMSHFINMGIQVGFLKARGWPLWGCQDSFKDGEIKSPQNRREGAFLWRMCACVFSHSVVSLCNPMGCSPPGSCVHGIFQTRILEWVAISSSRGSSQPRDWISVSCIGRQILYHWAPWEAALMERRALKSLSAASGLMKTPSSWHPRPRFLCLWWSAQYTRGWGRQWQPLTAFAGGEAESVLREPAGPGWAPLTQLWNGPPSPGLIHLDSDPPCLCGWAWPHLPPGWFTPHNPRLQTLTFYTAFSACALFHNKQKSTARRWRAKASPSGSEAGILDVPQDGRRVLQPPQKVSHRSQTSLSCLARQASTWLTSVRKEPRGATTRGGTKEHFLKGGDLKDGPEEPSRGRGPRGKAAPGGEHAAGALIRETGLWEGERGKNNSLEN